MSTQIFEPGLACSIAPKKEAAECFLAAVCCYDDEER